VAILREVSHKGYITKTSRTNAKKCKVLSFKIYDLKWGHAVAQLFEELRSKPEGRGFDSRWCHWNFLFT
jgi:hypothetical protein